MRQTRSALGLDGGLTAGTSGVGFELGLRTETANDGFFTGDPGVTTSLPYIGARVNGDVALGDPRAAVVVRLGISVFSRVDLVGSSELFQNSSRRGRACHAA